MEIHKILEMLRQNYSITFSRAEIFRENGFGNTTYTVYGAERSSGLELPSYATSTEKVYFLKAIHLPKTEMETATASMDVQVYLLENKFPVIPIVFTNDDAAFVCATEHDKEYIFVLSDFTKGDEPPFRLLEKAGALVGKLHRVMKGYPGRLPVRDKSYFIDRYVEIMRKIQYAKAEDFQALGDEMWGKIKHLPRGYCHCDMYDGNVHTTERGDMYIVDFDTSCMAFPGYDVALFCNRTHFFEYDYGGYEKTKVRLDAFLPGYLRYNALSDEEIAAFYVMLGIYHFQLLPAGLEMKGYDSGIVEFFDKQYDWLLRWKEQCIKMNSW